MAAAPGEVCPGKVQLAADCPGEAPGTRTPPPPLRGRCPQLWAVRGAHARAGSQAASSGGGALGGAGPAGPSAQHCLLQRAVLAPSSLGSAAWTPSQEGRWQCAPPPQSCLLPVPLAGMGMGGGQGQDMPLGHVCGPTGWAPGKNPLEPILSLEPHFSGI